MKIEDFAAQARWSRRDHLRRRRLDLLLPRETVRGILAYAAAFMAMAATIGRIARTLNERVKEGGRLWKDSRRFTERTGL